VAASLAGCAATGEVEYAGEVRVTSPELVMISPGVQVVADADEPLFYSEGMYWLYRDGYWYRSDSYRGGFARVDFVMVPVVIRTIERPQLYVQYRRHMGREQWARRNQQPQRTPQYQQPTYQQPTYTAPPTSPNTVTPVTPYQPGAAHPPPQPDGINPHGCPRRFRASMRRFPTKLVPMSASSAQGSPGSASRFRSFKKASTFS
jgi:hypothetical protein